MEIAFGKRVAEPALQLAVLEPGTAEVPCSEDALVHNPEIQIDV